MIKPWMKALAGMCAAMLLSAQSPPPAIEYRLTPLLSGGALRAVQIDLRFTGEADGETALRLPDAWGGREQLWRAIDNLHVVSGARLREGAGPAQRVLTHSPGAAIHVRYRIVQDYEGPPSAREGNAYRAVVQPDYFHLIGEAAIVTPEGADRASPVRFSVRGLPRGWSFASDLEHRGLTLGDLWSSISVGGDFRVLEAGAPNLRVAIRGEWTFSDPALIAEIDRIVSGHRDFWGDADRAYLVTVLPITQPEPGWLSIGGTGLGDAFAFFATPNAEADPITRTLAHESLHSWIPLAIGGLPDSNEALHYWLSEGFTDFYTGRLLVRGGMWSAQDFAADLNQTLRAYAFSSVREAPNARIGEAFWSDREVQQLPYQRGRLLASLWDWRLRQHGRSLDELMHETRARARSGAGPAETVFRAVAAEALGEFAEDYARHVEAGAPVLLPEDAFAPCGTMITRQAPRFDRGFDIAATSANGNVIAGVDPDLPAYAAGMRDGMTLLGREGGEIGNAELEIGYRVRDGEEERVIRYMPRGRGTATLQQIEIDPALEGDALARCLAVLGGR